MRVALGLGASLGDRRRTLERTVHHLAHRPGWRLLHTSRWYRSAPMRGGTATGWFLNGVAVFDTDDDPSTVLSTCRELEADAGRRRALHWSDRPLDLDVLYVEGFTSTDPTLLVPHPGIGSRAFVYWPLREAWPALDLRAIAPVPPERHSIVAIGAFARRDGAAYQTALLPPSLEPR